MGWFNLVLDVMVWSDEVCTLNEVLRVEIYSVK